jgi:hypothetical protein
VIKIDKYIGRYRIFHELDLDTGKATKNEFATYLLGKSKCEVLNRFLSLLVNNLQTSLSITSFICSFGNIR